MKNRAFVKYKKTGEIVPGSLIITQGGYPKGGPYKEITMDLCCDTNPCTPVDYGAWKLVTGGDAGDGQVLINDTNEFTFVGPNDNQSNGWVYLKQYFSERTCFIINYKWTSFDDDDPSNPPAYDKPVYWISTIEPTEIPDDITSKVNGTPEDDYWYPIDIPAGTWFAIGIYSNDSCCGRGFLEVEFETFTCYYTHLLAYGSDVGSACLNYPEGATTFYSRTSPANFGISTVLYTDVNLTTLAPNGYYVNDFNGGNAWGVSGGAGVIDSQTNCEY